MRQYRMPGGLLRKCQPGTRLERNLLAQGGELAADTDEGENFVTTPAAAPVEQTESPSGPLDGSVSEVLTRAEEFDYDALERLIRDETDGQNRKGVIAGFEKLKANAPGAPAKAEGDSE